MGMGELQKLKKVTDKSGGRSGGKGLCRQPADLALDTSASSMDPTIIPVGYLKGIQVSFWEGTNDAVARLSTFCGRDECCHCVEEARELAEWRGSPQHVVWERRVKGK